MKWLNPKNGDLTLSALAATVVVAGAVAFLCWSRTGAAGVDEELRNMSAWFGAMAVFAWTLSTAAVFKGRLERLGFLASCVGLSACALAFILVPQVFA